QPRDLAHLKLDIILRLRFESGLRYFYRPRTGRQRRRVIDACGVGLDRAFRIRCGIGDGYGRAGDRAACWIRYRSRDFSGWKLPENGEREKSLREQNSSHMEDTCSRDYFAISSGSQRYSTRSVSAGSTRTARKTGLSDAMSTIARIPKAGVASRRTSVA